VKTNLTGIYLFCSNEAQTKRFHDIFESLDETTENVRKQYNTIVLPLYQGFIEEKKPNYLSPDFDAI
jgi:hypothetical protein